MPSQSVEAATRDEAIAAAREQFGPSARVVGVRRIRSGGMFGFFANERFIAEVEVPADRPAPVGGPDSGSLLKLGPRDQRPSPSLDDRMAELADLLGAAAQESPAMGLYGRSGAAAESPAAVSPSLASLVSASRNAAGATPRATSGAAPRSSAAAAPLGSGNAPARSAGATARSAGATPKRTPVAAKPFTPTKHTLMLPPEDLTAQPAAPVAEQPAGPSPFAAALTRMVASNPVQAAADAAVDAAAEMAAAEAATAAQTAAVESAAAEAARAAAARIDAAAATAARTKAEAAAAEAARLRAQAAAAEAARLEAEAVAAEEARLEAEAVAAEEARLEAEAVAAEEARLEAARVEAVRIEAAHIEAARIEAERLQAERLEAARAEAARAEAARIEAARIEAERRAAEAAAAEAVRAEAARIEAARIEAARIEAERVAMAAAAAEAARVEAERVEAERVEAERIEAERIEAERIAAEAAVAEATRLEAARVAVEAAAARLQAEVQEAAPLSMVESVRSADEELAALLEEVLAANGSGRGRHRLPEAGIDITRSAADAAVAAATAIVESAAESAVPAAVTEERVQDVPRPWAYEGVEGNAYDTGSYRTDAYAGGWASDARVAQRAAQVAAAQNLVVDAVVVAESPAEEIRYVEPRPVEVPVTLARTASDPAPLPMDATMILPPLSLMPPQRFSGAGGTPPLLSSRPSVPPARRGRPPVPAGRPSVSGRPQIPTRPVPIPVPIGSRSTAGALPAAQESGTRLATVTRLVPAVSSSTSLEPFGMSGPDELVVQLLTLGVPEFLLGPDFAAEAAVRGVYAALTRTLSERLLAPPRVPAGSSEVLMVVGPGAETFAAARSLALSLRLEPEDVQWAASGALAGLAPEACRITSLDTAIERQRSSTATGSVTVIAVDVPLRTSGGPWLEHMLSVWSPSAVWAVLDSTRKPEDLVPWLDGLPQLDAVIVQDTESTADPAAVLSHVSVPVALVDGARATAHRWASLLCERLEELEA